MDSDKRVCTVCGYKCKDEDLLVGHNPFYKEKGEEGSWDVILGCPECLSIESMRVCCDEDDCWDDATCGVPTENGYRYVCGVHYRMISKEE